MRRRQIEIGETGPWRNGDGLLKTDIRNRNRNIFKNQPSNLLNNTKPKPYLVGISRPTRSIRLGQILPFLRSYPISLPGISFGPKLFLFHNIIFIIFLF